jgi:beta-lactamase class A
MYARASKPLRHTGVAIVFCLIVVAAIGLTTWRLLIGGTNLDYRNIFSIRTPPSLTPEPAFIPLDVEQRWRQVSVNYPTVSVSIELRDLDSSLLAAINQTTPRRAASTTKIITASYFLRQVEQGRLSLDQSLGATTAKYEFQQMVNQSNNDSWLSFLDLLGESQEEDFAHQIGLSSFTVSSNYIDTDDLTTFLQQLWQGKLLNQSDTRYLLSLMQNTNDENWIPPAIPADATIYQKYGALEDDVHDAAIIKTGGHVYGLVIMTNGNGAYEYDVRAHLFHDLVRATFTTN